MDGLKQHKVRADILKATIDSLLASHYRFSPKKTKQALQMFKDSIDSGDASTVAEAYRIADESLEESLSDLCSVLRDTAPEAAYHFLPGDSSESLREYFLPQGAEVFSVERAAWMIGVFGKGSDGKKYAAYRVFSKYVRWASAFLAVKQISRFLEEHSQGIGLPEGNQLEISRLLKTETRMLWISDEISASIGSWADVNLPKELGWLGSNSLRKMSKNVNAFLRQIFEGVDLSEPLPSTCTSLLLRGLPDKLIHALTAKPRHLDTSTLASVMLSSEPTLRPLVEIEGAPRVLERHAWLFQRDDIFFELLMRNVPSNAQGDILECIAKSLLNKWGPEDICWSKSVQLVRPKNRKKDTAPKEESNSDEIDLLGCSQNVVFIGECKANRESNNNSSIGSNFQDKILGKAATQLAQRLEHWQEGWRPSVATGFTPKAAVGFTVTISSYGGLLWQSDRVVSDGSPVQYSLFPLYSLILAVSTLETAKDLELYLTRRQSLIANGMINFDELEFVLRFLSAELRGDAGNNGDGIVLFVQYALTKRGLMIDPREYVAKASWRAEYRRALYAHTERINY